MMLRLIAPRIFHGNHNTAEKMLQTVKEWMDGADEDDRYLAIVRAGYQFNRALLLLDQGEEKNALEMFSNAVWVSTRYYCPSRHLIGHIQHWMMSYGVASNPAKGRLWAAVMMQAIDHVSDRRGQTLPNQARLSLTWLMNWCPTHRPCFQQQSAIFSAFELILAAPQQFYRTLRGA